jgi:hypothetical protein
VGGFDLLAFGHALEERDIAYQASQYAPGAEKLIVDPDNPPSAPQLVRGRADIQAWLQQASVWNRGLHVTHLIDGGDRVGFTERWHHQDGTTAVASSTAEIEDGLISMRHSVLVWDRDPD